MHNVTIPIHIYRKILEHHSHVRGEMLSAVNIDLWGKVNGAGSAREEPHTKSSPSSNAEVEYWTEIQSTSMR